MRHQEPGHLVFAYALGQIPSQLPWVWRKQNHDEADLYSANSGKIQLTWQLDSAKPVGMAEKEGAPAAQSDIREKTRPPF